MRVGGEVPLWECILSFASTDTRGMAAVIPLLDSIASCFASIELSVKFKLDALCKRKGPQDYIMQMGIPYIATSSCQEAK